MRTLRDEKVKSAWGDLPNGLSPHDEKSSLDAVHEGENIEFSSYQSDRSLKALNLPILEIPHHLSLDRALWGNEDQTDRRPVSMNGKNWFVRVLSPVEISAPPWLEAKINTTRMFYRRVCHTAG